MKQNLFVRTINIYIFRTEYLNRDFSVMKFVTF